MTSEKIIGDAKRDLLALEAMLELVQEDTGKALKKIALAKAQMAGVSTPAFRKGKRGKGLSDKDKAKLIAKKEKIFQRQIGRV